MFKRLSLLRQYALICVTVQAAVTVNALTTLPDEGGMAASLVFEDFAYKCRKIVGAGLNYKKILKQRNLEFPKQPVIFLKPASSLITEPQVIEIPAGCDVHHEVELGVIISKKCKHVNEYDSLNCIAGYCLALDLTEMNHLKKARASGLPWTIGKGFDTSCPVSDFIPEFELLDAEDTPLWLKVNGEMRQKSSTGDMLFKPRQLISHISQHMTLEPFDLVLTGTPAGTGPLKDGDVVEAGLGKGDMVHVTFKVKVVEPPPDVSSSE